MQRRDEVDMCRSTWEIDLSIEWIRYFTLTSAMGMSFRGTVFGGYVHRGANVWTQTVFWDPMDFLNVVEESP